MRKASWAIALLVLISTFHLAITIVPENVRGATLFVGGTGPGNYTIIQDAINASGPGDKVFVYNGTYFEHIKISESISLVGEDVNNTTIDGGGIGTVVNISADWVNFTGFTVANSGPGWTDGVGIEVFSRTNSNITNNVLNNTTVAVRLLDSTQTSIIGNTISSGRLGLELILSDRNTVLANSIRGSFNEAIYMWAANDTHIARNDISSSRQESIKIEISEDITIINNTVTDGDDDAISIWLGRGITIAENELNNNRLDAIVIYESHDSNISDNNITGNSRGVDLEDSVNVTIQSNNISISDWCGIDVDGSQNSNVIDNTLFRNGCALGLGDSINITFHNNTMVDNGIMVQGYDVENWNTHTIDTTNEVNGRPVIYWKNVVGGTIPLGAAQVILANCTGSIVENQELNSTAFGVSIGFSSNITVANSTFSPIDLIGIFTRFSDSISISDNNFSVPYGIDSELSDNVMIDSNIFPSGNGIWIERGDSVVFTRNVIPSGRIGVYFRSTSNSVIANNSGSGNWNIEFWNVTQGRITDNTLLTGPSSVFVDDSDNLTIADNNLRLNQGSIIVEDSNDIMMRGNELDSAVYVYFNRVSNISIIRNNMSNGTNMGIWAWHGDVMIVGNTASDSSDSAFYVLGTSSKTVADNVVSNSGTNLGFGLGLIGGRNEVHNNTVTGCGNGILVGDDFNSTISGNTVRSNTGHGISLSKSVNSTVFDNYVADNGGHGLYLAGTNGTMILNNTVIHNDGAGIHVNISTGDFISHNNVSQNSDGIYLYDSWSGVSANNTISLNTNQGLLLFCSWRNTIAHNTVTKNDWSGIHSIESPWSDVSNNTFSDNRVGLYFEGSSDRSTIINNTIMSNSDVGAFFWSSGTASIYHNSFIDNTKQAEEWGGANEWDDGYPSGGNFWSDYMGIDVMNGPNQDVLGSDNIGDTPYPLLSTYDRYPLMHPSGMKLPLPPTVLDAELTGTDYENVMVSWLPSLDESRLPGSIIGYEIRRNASFDRDGLGYQTIAFLPNESFEFEDILAGEGDPDNYFYIVCSIDASNRSDCASRQAAKFTRPLVLGSNLLSAPLIQSNDSVEVVLQTADWDKAWGYDSIRQEWEWMTKVKPYFGDMMHLGTASAIWMNVTEASNFTVAGLVPIQTLISLKTGWNLVGYPSFNSSYTTDDLRIQTGATRIEGYDPTKVPYHLNQLFSAGMLPGRGYWVWVDSDATWIVSNP